MKIECLLRRSQQALAAWVLRLIECGHANPRISRPFLPLSKRDRTLDEFAVKATRPGRDQHRGTSTECSWDGMTVSGGSTADKAIKQNEPKNK